MEFYCHCSLCAWICNHSKYKVTLVSVCKEILEKIKLWNRDTETCRKLIVFSVDGTRINLCHRENSPFSAFLSYCFIWLHCKNIYMHAKAPVLNTKFVTLRKKCTWEWAPFNFSITYKTVLLACQVLAKQENKNSEQNQDCIQFKPPDMKAQTHEIKDDFIKFYHHINSQPTPILTKISQGTSY